jgi:hypothetical protein
MVRQSCVQKTWKAVSRPATMTTNAEIENSATLRVLVKLHQHHPSPVEMSWDSVIDSEMERVFAVYDDDDLRRIVSDTIQRLHEAGVITGGLTIETRCKSGPLHRIHGASLSDRAFQILELVDSDCGGVVVDQAKIALEDANSRAIRVIGARIAGFLAA